MIDEDRARTVWLVRHAKAADARDGQKDFDRPLTGRGRRQCETVRDWLRARVGDLQATALVSPAVRAQQTGDLVFGEWFGGTCDAEPRIWNAPPQALAALVDECQGDLVLVGHNPGLEQLQYALTGQLMPMPTAGVFELEFGGQGRVRLAKRFSPDD